MRYIGLAAVLSLAMGAQGMAQGTSPIKVNSISVSPTSFKAGDQVTITIQLKNEGTRSYGCGSFEASVSIFKTKPYTVTNRVWDASQAVTSPMAAGAVQNVTFTSKWTVPNINTTSFHIMAWSPLCAPDEFGQNTIIEIGKECVYKYQPRFEFLARPIKPLRKAPLIKK
jgi:hypothetical protein